VARGGARVRGCEGARMRGCEGARVRGCEGARVRGCEGGWVGGRRGRRGAVRLWGGGRRVAHVLLRHVEGGGVCHEEEATLPLHGHEAAALEALGEDLTLVAEGVGEPRVVATARPPL
jgi:hypothetical protein